MGKEITENRTPLAIIYLRAAISKRPWNNIKYNRFNALMMRRNKNDLWKIIYFSCLGLMNNNNANRDIAPKNIIFPNGLRGSIENRRVLNRKITAPYLNNHLIILD